MPAPPAAMGAGGGLAPRTPSREFSSDIELIAGPLSAQASSSRLTSSVHGSSASVELEEIGTNLQQAFDEEAPECIRVRGVSDRARLLGEVGTSSDAPARSLGGGGGHAGEPGGNWQRWYTASILSVTTAFLFADQNLMAPNLTAIADTFGFNEQERDTKLGGEIALGFFLIGAPVAILVGYLTDNMDRRVLFMTVVFLGEVPCLLTYWVTKYWQLFVLRMLTGISIGGAIPLVFSILGDLCPVEHRNEVAVVPGMAMGIGQLLGQALSGYVGAEFNWRLPFVLVAVPTMLLALLMFFTTREAPRGAAEQALASQFDHNAEFAYSERLSLDKFYHMWRIPTNQAFPGCIPWGVLISYFNDFMAQEKGMGVAAATNVLLAFGIGCAVGNVAGGVIGQRLYNVSKSAFALFIAIATFVSIAPIVTLVNMRFTPRMQPTALALSFLGGTLASISGCNVRACLLNVNAPETRGTVFAFYNLMDDLGKGLGPGVVALLIRAYGRVTAFNLAMWAWVPCAVCQATFAFTLQKDEQSLQKQLSKVATDRSLAMSRLTLTSSGDSEESSTTVDGDRLTQ